MIRRSGQRGVPVITVDDEVIVGFDRARLQRAIARARSAAASPPRLGAAVADAEKRTAQGIRGAYVGKVTPGTPAARAGIAPGDVITRVDGQVISCAADLERTRSRLRAGAAVPVEVVRAGVPRRLSLQL
jgi:S1-C subfamily serine protease